MLLILPRHLTTMKLFLQPKLLRLMGKLLESRRPLLTARHFLQPMLLRALSKLLVSTWTLLSCTDASLTSSMLLDNQGDGQNDIAQLRSLLFRKVLYPTLRDLWRSGAAQPGDQPCVEAAVSEAFALQQLKEVLELREAWLR